MFMNWGDPAGNTVIGITNVSPKLATVVVAAISKVASLCRSDQARIGA